MATIPADGVVPLYVAPRGSDKLGSMKDLQSMTASKVIKDAIVTFGASDAAGKHISTMLMANGCECITLLLWQLSARAVQERNIFWHDFGSPAAGRLQQSRLGRWIAEGATHLHFIFIEEMP